MRSNRFGKAAAGILPGVFFVLVAVSLVAGLGARRTDDASWLADERNQVASALIAVSAELGRFEDASAIIGTRAAGALRAEGVQQDRIRCFSLLDSVLSGPAADMGLPPDTRVGVQLVARDGSVLAWAGWPRQLQTLDRVLVERGQELFYTRRVSLYRVLTHIVPVNEPSAADWPPGTVLVIDLPLEVNYRVNNRFLKSGSFADNVKVPQVADVQFDYFPATGNLVERLPRFRSAFEQRVADRERRRRRDNSAVSGRDSTLSEAALPENVLPSGELGGDAGSGLSGRVVAYAPQGNPLLGISVRGYPFAHAVRESSRRKNALARASLLMALLLVFARVLSRAGNPATRRGRFALAGFWFGGVVSFRYALLTFHGDVGGRAGWLFDPAVFATPALGGVLRSAGDLLITGGLFLVALYGVTRCIRGRRALSGESGGESSDRTGDPAAGIVERSSAVAEPVFVEEATAHSARTILLAVAVGGGVVSCVVVLCRRFVTTVVVNANPRLIGETMQLTSPDVLALHVGTFLVLTGIILSGVLVIWAVVRGAGGGSGTLARAFVGMLVVLVVASVVGSEEFAVVGIPLALFVSWAPRHVRREDLVSFVMVAFCLMIVTSITGYAFLTRNYDDLRREFVREKTNELLNPSDNWRVVILEDLLGQYAGRPEIRQMVNSAGLPDASRLAFDLWAEGPLSLLGYSCAIHVTTSGDSVISRFDVDMPYRARIGGANERVDTPQGEEWAVLDLTRATPRGIVRFYRGILNVRNMFADPSGRIRARTAGKVIIDLPFFFENLELAARTGPRTPELLRNVQEGTVAPRVEEPDALLLARIENGRIAEVSSERLAVGSVVGPDVLAKALDGRWPLLSAKGGTYRVTARAAGEGGRYLLAGFSAPSPARHLLRAATLFSLYLLFAFALIVTLVLLGLVGPLGRWLPSLVPGRRLGFQQKLLASFLLVALVPAVVLGIFGVDFMRERFVAESRREALDRAFSARKSMVNLLRGEQQVYLARSDLEAAFDPARPAVQAVGPGRVVMRFADTADALQFGAPPIAAVGTRHGASPDELFVIRRGEQAWIGVSSEPFTVSEAGWTGRFYLVYARKVGNDLLAAIADEVGADVNVYDGGHLVASSRGGLLAGGFVSSTMNGEAYTAVSLQGADHLLVTERAGRYRFQVAYLPVSRWGGDGAGSSVGRPVRAALGVPLLFRPESYAREVQRATSVLLGIFALLFTATMTIGLVLARGIFEPLRALLAGTVQIARGRYDVRVETSRADEIGTVVRAFNNMTRRISQSRLELEQRRRYLEAILESIGTGVIGVDAGGIIRTMNASAQKIAGVRAVDVMGKSPGELVRPESARALFALLDRRPEDSLESGEIVIQRDGARVTVKYMLTRIASVDGPGSEGAVLAVEDLTELIESKKLAAWVEMARQIAHEIKNPLTPIRISTQFMQRAWEHKPDQFETIFRESTETIMHQVDVLKRIAGEFSSYGRLQQLSVSPRPLVPLIEDILRPYRNNDAGVTVEFAPPGGRIVVECDVEAVRKICANLVENAFQSMSAGGTLRVGARVNRGAPGGTVNVVFRDTGSGLDPAVADRLFEPYFSTKTTGTGLGLAICRTLSREMGGDVRVENAADGSGVEATLSLPLADESH